MSRAIDSLWVAKHDDEKIPPRVKYRVFVLAGKRCEACTLLIMGKLRPEYDHKVALINGGAHAEDNLQLLCSECHKVKTRADVAEKSTMARKKLKAAGIRKPSTFQGSRDSIWKKKVDGSVVRR
jgi:5-methylcytosine-specific restriction protein A